MTLSQRPLENLHGFALLCGADVAVDFHRRLARRVPQQLLGDARMDASPDQFDAILLRLKVIEIRWLFISAALPVDG